MYDSSKTVGVHDTILLKFAHRRIHGHADVRTSQTLWGNSVCSHGRFLTPHSPFLTPQAPAETPELPNRQNEPQGN